MKQSIVKRYVGLLVLAGMTWACAGPSDSSSAANNNAPAQANPPPVASNATPLAVQPIPAPPAPAEKSAAKSNTNSAIATGASSGPSPKLVAPGKKIDFGKQPQDKTLVRTIAIRNGGRAILNIESVTPS